ncbi:hypothetical protein GCM10023149_18970 [Mucilaginibacter gynuensis]|uniref:Secretory protein n=1 Tax=Mucilaginibacter gynuensis TaxID=1302236 RepID=A0ABP8G9K3_9SPHI
MKLKVTVFTIAVLCCMQALTASAQGKWTTIGTYLTRDSITKKGYTLIFINKDSTFAQAAGDSVKTRMIDAFFKVYPAEAKKYNKKTTRTVTFIVDPGYKGVAAASDGIIRFNPGWMLRKPTDVDVVTHEVMHIVQEYGYSAGPVWLTEGIADYVRFKFGVDNEGSKWTMPEYKETQSYKNSYRITARFFVWIEKTNNKKLVVELDKRLRAHTYTADTWKELTSKNVDELWADYAKNPVI